MHLSQTCEWSSGGKEVRRFRNHGWITALVLEMFTGSYPYTWLSTVPIAGETGPMAGYLDKIVLSTLLSADYFFPSSSD